MFFCFGIHLAPYAVFSTRIYLQHIARPVESDRPINIVFVRMSVRPSVCPSVRPSVRPFFRSQFMNVGP